MSRGIWLPVGVAGLVGLTGCTRTPEYLARQAALSRNAEAALRAARELDGRLEDVRRIAMEGRDARRCSPHVLRARAALEDLGAPEVVRLLRSVPVVTGSRHQAKLFEALHTAGGHAARQEAVAQVVSDARKSGESTRRDLSHAVLHFLLGAGDEETGRTAVGLLLSDDRFTRAFARAALPWGSPATAAVLIEALRRGRDEHAEELSEDLWTEAIHGELPGIEDVLSGADTGTGVRRVLARALGARRNAAAADVLVRLLDDADEVVRARAAESLTHCIGPGSLGDERHEAILGRLLPLVADPSPVVRAAAAGPACSASAKLRRPVPTQVTALVGDQDRQVRMAALEALQHSGSRDASPDLVLGSLAPGRPSAEKIKAMKILAWSQGTPVTGAIARQLRDADPDVRRQAVEALHMRYARGGFGGRRKPEPDQDFPLARRGLLDLLRELPCTLEARNAAMVLLDLDRAESLPAVVDYVRRDQEDRHLVNLICRIEDPRSEAFLREVYKKGLNDGERAAAGTALAAMGIGIPALRRVAARAREQERFGRVGNGLIAAGAVLATSLAHTRFEDAWRSGDEPGVEVSGVFDIYGFFPGWWGIRSTPMTCEAQEPVRLGCLALGIGLEHKLAGRWMSIIFFGGSAALLDSGDSRRDALAVGGFARAAAFMYVRSGTRLELWADAHGWLGGDRTGPVAMGSLAAGVNLSFTLGLED